MDQVFEQGHAHRIEREDQAARADAVRQQHRPLQAPSIAGEQAAAAVFRPHIMHIGSGHPQRPLVTRRFVAADGVAAQRERAIDLEQRAREAGAKAREPLQARTGICDIEDLDRLRQVGHVLGRQPQDAHSKHRAALIFSFVKGDEQRGAVAPDVEAQVIADDLKAAEEVLPPVLGEHWKAIAHIARVGLAGVADKEIEKPRRNKKRTRMQGRRHHATREPRGVIRLVDHRLQIVAVNRQDEAEA